MLQNAEPASPSREDQSLGDLLREAGRVPPGVDLRGARLVNEDLRGIDFSGHDARGADFSECDLSNTRWLGANLEGTTFFGATLNGADFLKASMPRADLSNVDGEDVGFGGANLDDALFRGARVHRGTFTRASLERAELRAASFTGSRFRAASLVDADLERAELRMTDFEESRVHGARFNRTQLHGAHVRGMRGYKEASWIAAHILEVDFCGAYLLRRHIMDENFLHEFRYQSKVNQVIYALWWLTSDCGRSLLRWATCTVGIGVAFGALYSTMELNSSSPVGWFTPYYFSFVTLTTLGYGDVLPATHTQEILVAVEVLTGYLMLGGLLSIFANKMARRAD